MQPMASNIKEAVGIDNDAEAIAPLTSLLPCNFDLSESALEQRYNLGRDHDWSSQTFVVSYICLYTFIVS